MSYNIFETDEFLSQLENLPSHDSKFIHKKLFQYVYPQIKNEPFYGKNIKKLKGYSPETWRYRIGRFRVFYVVDTSHKTIYVLYVDFRKDAYR